MDNKYKAVKNIEKTFMDNKKIIYTIDKKLEQIESMTKLFKNNINSEFLRENEEKIVKFEKGIGEKQIKKLENIEKNSKIEREENKQEEKTKSTDESHRKLLSQKNGAGSIVMGL